MGFILGIVWSVIGYVVSQTSLLVWVAMMFPQPVERARARVLAKPGASFFTGLAIWGFSVLVGVSMLKEGNPGPVQLMGWLVLGPMLTASIVGGAGLAQIISARLQERSERIGKVSGLVGGALCTTFAGLVPIVGWFVVLPIASFIAIGAGAFALLKREKPQPLSSAFYLGPTEAAADASGRTEAVAAWSGHTPAA